VQDVARFGLAFGKMMNEKLEPISPVGFRMPENVVDSHCHIFCPAAFPYAAGRRYTPPSATVEDLCRFHSRVHVRRAVCVQPSVYGIDNACLVDALKRLGPQARGVAVIDSTFSGQQLDDLMGAGVVGVRINLEVDKDRDINGAVTRLEETVATLRGRSLLIQMYAALPLLSKLADRILSQPHTVVIDHFGLARASCGPRQSGMSTLIRLMQSGKAFVKLSGPYQISNEPPGYADTVAIGRVLTEAAPGQTIWGSNWPHTGGSGRPARASPAEVQPFRNEDEGRNLALVESWAPHSGDRYKLLVENATRLFGFAPT
jgi:predicted TIM-barrel fold metal-dependent hydrolase